MTVYNGFVSPTLGMMAQAHALNTIGINLANINTGGFKSTETRFSTVLSDTLDNQSDLGGVKPKDFQKIDKQGFIVSSLSDLDVAINGRGFFIVNTEFDGSGQTLYTRDGSFEIDTEGTATATVNGAVTTIKKAYLVDKNGYFVQGLERDATTGTFLLASTLKPLRVDQFAFSNIGEATTKAELRLNLPANDAGGSVSQYNIDVFDSLGKQQSVALNFTKGAVVNQWSVTATNAQTPVAQVETVTLGGTVEALDVYSVTVNGNTVSYTTTGIEANLDAVRDALVAKINVDGTVGGVVTAAAGGAGALTLTAKSAGDTFTATTPAPVNGGATADNTATNSTTTANVPSTTTSAPVTMTFNPNGAVTSPTSLSLALTFAGGTTAAVALDVSGITQFAGDFTPFVYTKNGFAATDMTRISFDSRGQLIGVFDNSTDRAIYKVPLAQFANPNALEMKNGNVFAETADSGTAKLAVAGPVGFATFLPNSRELSNVDLADEFTRMIVTQTAYNSSASVFRTVDQMTETARDLKR